MDKTRKKNIRRIVAWVSLVALVALLTAMPLLAKQNAEADGPVATIKSDAAHTGTITQVLSGGGILTEEDAETLTIPTGVKLKAFLVSNGDTVSAGDALVEVDKLSVMEAITQIQETLDYLTQQIKAADSSEGSTKIKSQTSGKVKLIYAEAGDNVQDVILEHGALAVLSLDGRMAVSLKTDAKLSAGDTMTVTLSDGTQVSGRVESCLGGDLKVSVTDDNFTVGQEVTLTTLEGTTLGTGTLEVHNPWNATAYFGTVSTVHVKENQSVSSGTVLFTLKDVDHATNRALLVAQRQEYEALMQKLFTMYESGVIAAPCDGIVSGVDEESPHLLSAQEDGWFFAPLSGDDTGWTIQLLSGEVGPPAEDPENPENPSDPTDPTEPEAPLTYTVRVGTVKAAESGKLTLLMANGTQTVTALKDVMISTSQMTTPAQEDISAASVYELAKDGLKPLDYTAIKAGDILLFVTDIKGAYAVVRTTADGGQKPGGNMGGMGGFAGMGGGYGGGTQSQPAFQPYDLTETAILTVTPAAEMTLDITIDELDIGLVQPGMEAKVTVTALGAETFTGTVTRIGTATNNGGNSKFTVTITLQRADRMLGGMSATAVMELTTLRDALLLPTAALQEDGSQVFVYTGYDAKKETFLNPVTVTIGASDGEFTQILTGLSEGDTCYYAYYDAPETE